MPSLGHHRVLAGLPDDAISAIIDIAGPDSGAPLLLAELRHLGGALRRPAENSGALEKLDGEFVMLGVGMLMDPALREPITGSLDKLAEAMNPWAADGGFFNYAERPCEVDAICPPRPARASRRSSATGTRTTSSSPITPWHTSRPADRPAGTAIGHRRE